MGASEISLNGLYEFGTGTPFERVERLLWIDRARVAVLIEVRGAHSREHSVSYRTFYDDVSNRTARRVEELPEFTYLMQPDSAFSATQIRERDDRYAAMRIFLEAPPEKRFDPSERAKLFAEIVSRQASFTDEEVKELTDPQLIQILIPRLDSLRRKDGSIRNPLHLNKGTLYIIFRRLQQSGGVQRINGLISLRHKSGWHTENRLTHVPTKKLGRSWIGETEEERRSGRIITPDLVPVLVNIGILFHERPVNGVKLNWPEAVRLGQQQFLNNGFKMDGDVPIPMMPPASELFSEWQIRRTYYKHRHASMFLPQREGERAFNLTLRATIDDQRAIASRPMQVVQSDCWDCSIYIVHPVTRSVIGRPLLVMMRDTFSRMIVAYALTWNHEGGRTNLLALENLVSDKVQHCRELGIEIDPAWWPCKDHMFENLLSDNGAWITKMAAQVRSSLGVMEIWNTGTGRGDMKPVIETIWDDLYDRLIKTLPGALPPHAISADTDPIAKLAWQRAALDLSQLERLIVRYILHHNRFRYFDDYPLTDAMKGKVRPIPLELWNSGMDEDGLPNPMTMDTVRINCLEPIQLTVTRDGLRLQDDLFYSCQSAEDEGWFSRAAAGHTWKVGALLDRRRTGRVFLIRDKKRLRHGDRELEDCWRIKARREETNLHLEEIQFEQDRQKAERNRYKQEMPGHDAWLDGHRDQIVAEAEQMTAEALDGAKQTKGDWRARRKDAKDQENGINQPPPEVSSEQLGQIGPASEVLADASDSEFDLYRA